MARKPHWQSSSTRQIYNDSAKDTLRQWLRSKDLLHLEVLSRGDHVVVYSDDQGDKFNRVRFTRVDVTKAGETYELGIAHHTGRWESTPFTGTLEELFEMVTGQFGWLLEDFQTRSFARKELARGCTRLAPRYATIVLFHVYYFQGPMNRYLRRKIGSLVELICAVPHQSLWCQ